MGGISDRKEKYYGQRRGKPECQPPATRGGTRAWGPPPLFARFGALFSRSSARFLLPSVCNRSLQAPCSRAGFCFRACSRFVACCSWFVVASGRGGCHAQALAYAHTRPLSSRLVIYSLRTPSGTHAFADFAPACAVFASRWSVIARFEVFYAYADAHTCSRACMRPQNPEHRGAQTPRPRPYGCPRIRVLALFCRSVSEH